MDVVLTKDNEVLLSHDPVLNPDITRDERGRFLAPSHEVLKKRSSAERAEYERKYAVRGMTLAELGRFDVGRLITMLAARGLRVPDRSATRPESP